MVALYAAEARHAAPTDYKSVGATYREETLIARSVAALLFRKKIINCFALTDLTK